MDSELSERIEMEFTLPNTKWIWSNESYDETKKQAELVLFRKKFVVSQEMLQKKKSFCGLRVSADTRYKLYLNEKLMEIGPSKGDFDNWFYDEINIGPQLVEGENILAVEVLHYPSDNDWGNFSLFRTNKPGLYVEEYEPGHKEPIDQTLEDYVIDKMTEQQRGLFGLSADESWKCKRYLEYKLVPETEWFAPLTIMEEKYGDEKNAGWKSKEYDDAEWNFAVPRNIMEISTSTAPGNLYKRTIPYMFKKKKEFCQVKCCREGAIKEQSWNEMLHGIKNVTLNPFSKEIVEIDAGEEETGFVLLELIKGKGTRIRVLYAEAYGITENSEVSGYMELPVKNDRTDSVHGELHGFSDIYEVAGYGGEDQPECYSPFWFRTFRYIRLEIETADVPITIKKFEYKETGYPLEVMTKVKTSDESLSKIWEISERTLRRCMQET